MSATPSTKFDPIRTLYGAPHVFGDICLIYPLTLRDIAQIGAEEFYHLLYHITVYPPSLHVLLKDMSSYEFILERSNEVEFAKLTRKAISLFLHEESLIIPDAKILALGGTSQEEKFQVLSQEQFEAIQDIIRQQYWMRSVYASGDKQASDSKTQEILNKLARGRETVAGLKANKANVGPSFSDLIGSMAIAIPGLNITNIWDLTYYAFYDQFQRYQQKEAYDGNVRAALAGAKISKEKLKGWIHPIDM